MRSRRLNHTQLFILIGLLEAGTLSQDTFTPPHAYPVERYQPGWDKNPFTLKTAPPALKKVSFAEHLAIGSCFGSKDDPTVVVVNTKTGERTTLKRGAASASGMELKSASIMPRRSETTAEVTMGGETAVLRFDDAYLRQQAATQPGSRGAAPSGNGGVVDAPPGAAAPPGMPLALGAVVAAPPGGSAPTHASAGPRPPGSSSAGAVSNPAERRRLMLPGMPASFAPPAPATRTLRNSPPAKAQTPPPSR